MKTSHLVHRNLEKVLKHKCTLDLLILWIEIGGLGPFLRKWTFIETGEVLT